MLLPGNEVRSAYDRWSFTYDNSENRTRDLDAEYVRRILGDSRFSVIVETGCGTGKNTGFLATIADSVKALDFSPGMLAVARETVESPRVSFEECDLKGIWPIDSGSASLVVCSLVLEHFSGLDDYFAEAARVLARGGRLLISELHPFRQYAGSQARISEDAEARIEAHIHNISDYLSAAEKAGFELAQLHEAWHSHDCNKPPRLLILDFTLKQL